MSNNRLSDFHYDDNKSHFVNIHTPYCNVILMVSFLILPCYIYLCYTHYVIKVQIIVIVTAAINHYDVKWGASIY